MGRQAGREGAEPKKRKKKSRVGDKIYALVVLLLGAAIIAISFLLLFHIQNIEIKGNTFCSNKEIGEWLQDDPYTKNSAYLMVKYKAGKIKKLPHMESVKVTMKNPWTIKVNITEKKVIGFIIDGGQYVYFDKEGLVLKKSSEFVQGLPCIEEMEVSSAKLFQKLPVEDEKVFEHILRATQTLKELKLAPQRIVSDGSNIDLYFGKICVKLGSANVENKIPQLPPILEKLKGKEGILHLEHYGDLSSTISFEEMPLEKSKKKDKSKEMDKKQDENTPADNGGNE